MIEISIAEAMETYGHALAPVFEGAEPGLAEENIQARIRGNLIMALSNKFGWLVLTTGNKSELSVRDATLYGDMAGGFAVIKDVFKLLVYRLVRWRNEQQERELIPESVLERPPWRSCARISREDTLPPTSCSTASWRHTSSATRGSRPWSPRDSRRTRSWRSSAWSTAPNTSAARHHPESASRPRHSAATGACRSPTGSARCARFPATSFFPP